MTAFPVMNPGTLLHGRYRIVRKIGAGGMGAVFEAVDTRLQNTVAVKQTTAGPLGERAFEREAKILAALRHPALPVVTDYFSEGDGQFLVMQFIEGDDLSRLLRRQVGPCAADDVKAWAHIILDALSYLHSHQPPVVHRDIKPANLRRTPRGEIVMLDFGLAKARVDVETRLAADRSLYGYTPSYAPPEQIDGRPTDARSDIYALGATLYHLAVGLPPRTATDRLTALREGRPDPLTPPHLAHPGLDEPFSRVLMHALHLDPRHRFASAEDMRAALDQESGRRPRAHVAPPGGARRVDAAMPSQIEVGGQTDLIVQVRFASSPLLGLEDWPTRRRPDHIEQGSESLQLTYPVDPATGAPLPARVRIKVVAPDFVIGGAAEHLVDVPPDDFSKRLAFLLTAQRAGFCRVNVEVFGHDAVYLGSIPVEVEAAGAARQISDELRVANLVLEVFARQQQERERTRAMAESMRPPGSAPRPPAAVTVRPDAAPTEAVIGALGAASTPRPPLPAVAAAPASSSGRSFNKVAVFVPLAMVVIGTATMWWRVASRSTPEPVGTVAASSPAPVAVPSPMPAEAAPPPPAPGRASGAAPGGRVAAGASPRRPADDPTARSAPAARPAPVATVPTQPVPTPTPMPVPPPAMAPPATAPLPTQAQDRASISAVLDALAAGHSSKDVAAIVKVWPTAPAAELQATFASYVSHTMVFSGVTIVLDGDRATATGTVITTTTVNTSDGPRTSNETRQISWRLQRSEVSRRVEGVFVERERVWLIVGPG